MMKLSKMQYDRLNDNCAIRIKRGSDFANVGEFITASHDNQKINIVVFEKITQLKIGGLTMEDTYYTLIKRKEIC